MSQRRPPATPGKIAEHHKQGRALYVKEQGRVIRITESEHILPFSHIKEMTKDPRTGKSPFTERDYRNAYTLLISRDAAVAKTQGNTGDNQALRDYREHQRLFHEGKITEAAMLQAAAAISKEAAIRRTMAAGAATNDPAITLANVIYAMIGEEGQIHVAGRAHVVERLNELSPAEKRDLETVYAAGRPDNEQQPVNVKDLYQPAPGSQLNPWLTEDHQLQRPNLTDKERERADIRAVRQRLKLTDEERARERERILEMVERDRRHVEQSAGNARDHAIEVATHIASNASSEVTRELVRGTEIEGDQRITQQFVRPEDTGNVRPEDPPPVYPEVAPSVHPQDQPFVYPEALPSVPPEGPPYDQERRNASSDSGDNRS